MHAKCLPRAFKVNSREGSFERRVIRKIFKAVCSILQTYMMTYVTKINNSTLGTLKLPMKRDLPKNVFIITSKAVTKCLSLLPGFKDFKNKINKYFYKSSDCGLVCRQVGGMNNLRAAG
jgi:hypothetical protein